MCSKAPLRQQVCHFWGHQNHLCKKQGCRVLHESLREVVATPVVEVVQLWQGVVGIKNELIKGMIQKRVGEGIPKANSLQAGLGVE